MDRGLEFLRGIAASCTRCPLADHRELVVFGTGPASARLMLVGEAPGPDEDKAGTPFIGLAGRRLNALLAEVGIDRSLAYVTNVAMCRPTLRPAPTLAEVERCSPYLDLQLAVVRPLVIVAFGSAATRRLLGTDALLQDLRGRVHTANGASVVPTWHPSGWTRQPDRRAQALRDLTLARTLLDDQPESSDRVATAARSM